MQTNKVTIKITAINPERIGWRGDMLTRYFNETLMLRTARKVGDTETINKTQLSRLNECAAFGGIKYEIIK